MSLLRVGLTNASDEHPSTTGDGELRAWAVRDALDGALSATGAEIAEIFLREANSDDVSLAGFQGPFYEAFHQITHFEQGQGYPGLVVLQGRPLESNEAFRDKRLLRTQVKEAGFRRFICVPIPGRKRPVGSLGVAWRTDGNHSGALCVLLSREAERLALILDHEQHSVFGEAVTEAPEDGAATDGRLDLRLLGSFEARHNGILLSMDHFARRRSLTLLKLLVTNYGKVLGRDELIEQLWPADPPADAPQLLKSAAHYLRRALGEAHDEKANAHFVLTTPNGYAFNPTSFHWIDAVEFRRFAEAGLRLERQGRWREAIAALETAAELHTGDYLEDEPYSEWAIPHRRHLRELLFDVLQASARLLRSSGDYEAAIRYDRRMLELDPCLEDVHRDLMELLCRSGKRIQALRQFESCRRALKEEFDSSPLLETEALYRSILNGSGG